MKEISFKEKKVHMASDHAGFKLKEELKSHLENNGYTVYDHGCNSTESCDYPIYASTLCEQVLETALPGILICGSGIGMSIVANRFKGIRAALCSHEFQAISCREHNNANVICFGERITAPGLATVMTELFLDKDFAGGRHARRLQEIDS